MILEGRLGEPLHLDRRGVQLAAVVAVSVVGGQGGHLDLGRHVRRYLADQHLTLVYPLLGPALRSLGVVPRQHAQPLLGLGSVRDRILLPSGLAGVGVAVRNVFDGLWRLWRCLRGGRSQEHRHPQGPGASDKFSMYWHSYRPSAKREMSKLEVSKSFVFDTSD